MQSGYQYIQSTYRATYLNKYRVQMGQNRSGTKHECRVYISGCLFETSILNFILFFKGRHNAMLFSFALRK